MPTEIAVGDCDDREHPTGPGPTDYPLILTSDPGPAQTLDQAVAKAGSMMDHPEVTESLAAMPAQEGLQMLMVRRGALARQFAPLAGMADPDLA